MNRPPGGAIRLETSRRDLWKYHFRCACRLLEKIGCEVHPGVYVTIYDTMLPYTWKYDSIIIHMYLVPGKWYYMLWQVIDRNVFVLVILPFVLSFRFHRGLEAYLWWTQRLRLSLKGRPCRTTFSRFFSSSQKKQEKQVKQETCSKAWKINRGQNILERSNMSEKKWKSWKYQKLREKNIWNFIQKVLR